MNLSSAKKGGLRAVVQEGSGSTPASSQPLKGILLAVSGAICWGISGTFGQFLIQQKQIDVEWIIVVRMLLSGAILLLISLFRGRRPRWKYGINGRTRWR